jgi:hypothetical protein
MPLENWVQHSAHDRFLYDWQTLIAGVLAVLAAAGTIWATIRSANREIAASQAQTAVAQKQVETTIRLAEKRDADEFDAFRVMLEAAMTRVLAEVAWAKTTYPQLLKPQTEGATPEALTVRQCITKGAFGELRGACVRQRSPLTGEFLGLEMEIDNFALQYEDRLTNASVLVCQQPFSRGLIDSWCSMETQGFGIPLISHRKSPRGAASATPRTSARCQTAQFL